MTYVLRAARPDDLAAVYEMARTTGGGFTNLPANKAKLAAKLANAELAFTRTEDTLGDDMFFFVLENVETGAICGTCQIFSQIGTTWPFYSYRIDSFATYSKDLGRSINTEQLTLSTDLTGCSEVGGLFLDPSCRATGVGKLLARSRYLFMRAHRPRFANRTVSELRGVIDENDNSPFWDELGGRFFGIDFVDADKFNALNGNQFIADLMPKNPIYTVLLSDSARQVMGVPHPSGRAAMRMLEKEGFLFENYIDIFDGGPTMTASTDGIATIRDAQESVLVAIEDEMADGADCIVASGRLNKFRACCGRVSPADGGIVLDTISAKALDASPGDRVTYVAR